MWKINGQKVWLTSDWHHQHLNLVRGTSKWIDTSHCRDFNNPQEMWELLRNNINKLVKPQDIIVNLGDIIFGDKTQLPNMLSEINCKNILYCRGNHCKWFFQEKYKEYQKCFNLGFYDYKELVILKRLFICCHYRFMIWNEQSNGSIHTFGHSHASSLPDTNSKAIDVGVDNDIHGHEKYTPWEDKEIISVMDKYYKFKNLDHHT